MFCLSDPGIYHVGLSRLVGVFPKENKIFWRAGITFVAPLWEQNDEGDEERGRHPPVPSSHQQLRTATHTHARTRICAYTLTPGREGSPAKSEFPLSSGGQLCMDTRCLCHSCKANNQGLNECLQCFHVPVPHGRPLLGSIA